MAGVKGRSGRKPKPLAAHLLAGTYRPDRHGPLPEGGRAAVLRGPGAVTVGATALSMPTPVDVPTALLAGLADDGVALVRAAYEHCEVSGSEAVILRSAAEAADRIAQVRKQIETDGVVLTTARGGKYAHPLLKIEKAAAAHLLAALRALGLPMVERS